MANISKRFVCQNTAKNTKWAVRTLTLAVNCYIHEMSIVFLGKNIDVDILSRPVDKDSNCTELFSGFAASTYIVHMLQLLLYCTCTQFISIYLSEAL